VSLDRRDASALLVRADGASGRISLRGGATARLEEDRLRFEGGAGR
jgi:hypothetical protein